MTASPDTRSSATAAIDIARVVVPVDSASESGRALATAGWLAAHLGAGLDVVHVASPDQDEQATAEFARIARAHGAHFSLLPGTDVADVLAAHVTIGQPALVCMTTRGRDHAAAILGSTAADLLEQLHAPIVLVGPHVANSMPDAAAPVAVAVSGHDDDDDLVQLAAGWAARLDRDLLIVTVIEPAPLTLRGDHLPSRAHGPADPASYLDRLITSVGPSGVSARGEEVEDPVSAGDGLLEWTARATPALVMIGAHHRDGLGRLVHGSTAAHVVAKATCPVVAVAVGWRR